MNSLKKHLHVQECFNRQLTRAYSVPSIDTGFSTINSPNPFEQYLNNTFELHSTLVAIHEAYNTANSSIECQMSFADTLSMVNTFNKTLPHTPQILELHNVLSTDWITPIINPLLTEINRIRVFPNYVEAPEILTSDNLSKETLQSLSQTHSDRKKLSRSDVAWLVMFLLTLLSWLFPDPLSNFQENTATETFSITQEQGEQIIECLVLLTEYLENHSDETNDATCICQEHDLLPSDSQPEIATPDSAIQSNLEADSKHDNTESNSKVE